MPWIYFDAGRYVGSSNNRVQLSLSVSLYLSLTRSLSLSLFLSTHGINTVASEKSHSFGERSGTWLADRQAADNSCCSGRMGVKFENSNIIQYILSSFWFTTCMVRSRTSTNGYGHCSERCYAVKAVRRTVC